MSWISPVDKISDTLKVSGRHISVDAPFVEGEDNSLLDVLVNDDAPIADRSLMNESLAKEIDRALATLTERECEIIKMFFRYWLSGNDIGRDWRQIWPH